MRRDVAAIILVAALFLAACVGGGPSTQQDPRDVLVMASIKKAMAAKGPTDYLALYAGNPDLERDMHHSERMMILAGVMGEVNGNDIDLSRIQNVKLKPEGSRNPASSYWLKGTFTYSGPAVIGSTKAEVPEGGTGRIMVGLKQNKKDGSWYLDKLSFELTTETRRAALKGGKR